MKAGYVDTSCLVAIAFGEPGHEELMLRLGHFDVLFSSNLLEAELRSAFARERVDNDPEMAGLSWVLPDRALTSEIGAVLDAGYLRAADLWHLACALYLSPEPRDLTFLTVDAPQATVASRLGFPL